MYKIFNKLGNIEIKNDTLTYRIEIEHVNDDIAEIEKSYKQKIIEAQTDAIISPSNIEFKNRFLLVHYNMKNYQSINQLRENSLYTNITYFNSLVYLAKLYEQGLIFSFDRLNFVVDAAEEKVKIFFVETNEIKIYEKVENIVHEVRNLITSTLTTENDFKSLPKRSIFIDASDNNINFVERLFKIETLDDLEIFLDTIYLELTEQESIAAENEAAELEAQSKGKGKKKVKKKKVTKKSAPVAYGHKKKSVSKTDNTLKYSLIGLGVVGLLFISTLFLPDPNKTQTDLATAFATPSEAENQIIEAYRAVYKSEVDESYQLLKNLDADLITEEDTSMLIDVYFRSDKSVELIEKYPFIANEYITYLISKDLISQLGTIFENVETDNPYINFEIAYLNNELDNVLLYKDMIELNPRRHTQIVTSLVRAGENKKALEFAKETKNPDLIKMAEQAGI